MSTVGYKVQKTEIRLTQFTTQISIMKEAVNYSSGGGLKYDALRFQKFNVL